MRKPAVPKTKTGKSQELNSDAPRCGLCGKRGGLIQTECCGQWICDDEDNYVLFSYARNSGAKLAPGNSIGSMMFSNSLTLSAGSTTMLEISKAPLANDLVNVLGNLTYGGTLVVTNPGAVTLTAGDSFPLFNALSHASSFNSLVLPPLGTNLMWDTNGFIVSGTLAVISTAPPAIDSVATLGDGNFRLIFSGPTTRSDFICCNCRSLTLNEANHLACAGDAARREGGVGNSAGHRRGEHFRRQPDFWRNGWHA